MAWWEGCRKPPRDTFSGLDIPPVCTPPFSSAIHPAHATSVTRVCYAQGQEGSLMRLQD